MLSNKKVPDLLSVVVYSAKGLKPRKDERCKFTVVFGVGSKKFKSDTVEDFHGCPTFNTEMEINISDPTAALTFKVVEKHTGDTLGKVSIPILDLPNNPQDGFRTVSLQPYKKNTVAHGELIFKAWIAGYRTIQDDDVRSVDSWKKSSLSLGLSKIKDKLLHRNDSAFNLQHNAEVSSNFQTFDKDTMKKKSFSSFQDLSTLSLVPAPPVAIDDLSLRSYDSNASEFGSNIKPEVSGISPREGPVNGGTKLVIRGQNLGRGKEDVIGLYVCGSNVLSSLEFISSTKLTCVTKAWKPCAGNVTVETQSGGRGVSLVQFTFMEPPQVFDGGDVAETGSSAGSAGGGSDGGSPYGSLRKVGSNNMPNQKSKSLWALGREPQQGTTTNNNIASNIELTSMFGNEPILKPEITGISPKEAPYYKATKLTIRGAHLGASAVDISKIMVCGKDYIDTLEYESPSKIVCQVGPVAKATWGDIMVETISGGVGISLVEFKFIDDKLKPKDLGGPIPISRDLNKERGGGFTHAQKSTTPPPSPGPTTTTTTTLATTLSTFASQHAATKPATTTTTTAATTWSTMYNSSNTNAVRPSMTTMATTTTARNSVAPPPVVEIQPIQRMKELDEITILENKLKLRDREIAELVSTNKKLSEECGRLKEYMELLVSRAMVTCPHILAVESQFR